MEKFEKEILSKYKLWQKLFEENSNNSKDNNKSLLDKDFDSPWSGGCKGCGCYADVRIKC